MLAKYIVLGEIVRLDDCVVTRLVLERHQLSLTVEHTKRVVVGSSKAVDSTTSHAQISNSTCVLVEYLRSNRILINCFIYAVVSK